MKAGYVIGGILLAGVLIAGLYQAISSRGSALTGVEVNWRLLGDMDYISGKATPDLEALNGKAVKIPGFMVPLEDNSRQAVEFLLVPTPQACIHVPPPPPNQMVYVKMKRGADIATGPIWVYGTLNLITKKSMYGDASFEIQGEGIEAYK